MLTVLTKNGLQEEKRCRECEEIMKDLEKREEIWKAMVKKKKEVTEVEKVNMAVAEEEEEFVEVNRTRAKQVHRTSTDPNGQKAEEVDAGEKSVASFRNNRTNGRRGSEDHTWKESKTTQDRGNHRTRYQFR